MPSLTRSIRQQQRDLASTLRSRQKTWAEVAAAFCKEYGVNVRAALRMARGWSQRDAADRWNARWPDDPKTFKNFSYWEQWPAATGHAPSLAVLARLAELYECSLADLVADCADFRRRDTAYQDGERLAELPAVLGIDPNEPDLRGLIARLELIDIQELARLTSTWSERLGAATSRRALLLKLSAALSMAAAAPAAADDSDHDSLPRTATIDGDLSGIWHSRYRYSSTGRGSDLQSEHYILMRHVGDRLFGQSLPSNNGSRVGLDLSVNGNVATGTWSERTSPAGYYRGSVYHGALQFVIDPLGKSMRGRWVGFNRESAVDSDLWHLDWVREDTGKGAQRDYHFQA